MESLVVVCKASGLYYRVYRALATSTTLAKATSAPDALREKMRKEIEHLAGPVQSYWNLSMVGSELMNEP